MVLVLVEHAGGAPAELSLQALTLARRYAGGDPVEAIVFGAEAGAVAAALGEHGVGTVHVAEHDALQDGYAPAAWARAVAQLATERSPSAIVAAGSDRGQEVLAHAAAMTDGAFAANCVEATPGEPAVVTRMRWGGSVLEEARVHGPVKLLTVAPHAVGIETAAAGSAVVERFTPALEDSDLVVRVEDRVVTSTGGLSLADAPVVVAGGRGVGSTEAPAGARTPTRSGRPARRSRRTSTSPPGSVAPPSTWRGAREPRRCWRLTPTRTRRSWRTPTTR